MKLQRQQLLINGEWKLVQRAIDQQGMKFGTTTTDPKGNEVRTIIID